MNVTILFAHLLVLGYVTSTFAMELNRNPQERWNALVQVLPKLTIFEQRPVLKYGMHSFTTVQDAQKEFAYQEALVSDNPLVRMREVACPVFCTREDIRNGKPVVIRSRFTFPLADFALGVLCKQQGYYEEAEHAFENACTIEDYKPQDEPIAYAAQCAQFLLRNQYDYAFRQLQLLQHKMLYYPSWQTVIPILRNMFVDAQYAPVFHELAQEGSVDAQYHLLQEAIRQAVDEKAIDAQISRIERCTAYFESIDQHPELRPLVEVVRAYTHSAQAYTTKCYDAHCYQRLFELLDAPSQDAHIGCVQQLGSRLVEALAQEKLLPACCYLIAQHLKSGDKKVQRKGLVSLAVLMQEHAAAKTSLLQTTLEQFGVPARIEAIANNKNSVASCIWAHMQCREALQKDKETLFDPQAQEVFEAIKQYAQTGNTKSCAQKELMQSIISFADIVSAYHRKDFNGAAKKCLEIYIANTDTTQIEHMILLRAGDFLEALAKQGQLDACVWKAHVQIVKDGAVITPEVITYCCEVAGQFVERATAEQLSGDSSKLLCTTLKKIITTCDSAYAKYALSRLLFVQQHVDREYTGISINEGNALDEAFKYAAVAAKAGHVESARFVKALMLYRGIQGLYAQKKDADAVDRVFDLMALDLPQKEKKVCDAFAQHSLRMSAACGTSRARAWRLAQLLESVHEQDKELALNMACQVFGECMSLDFDTEPIETWQTKLRYYKEYNVIEKIGALYKTLTDEHLLAQSEYILAIVSLLRALTAYQLLESSEQPSKELLLQTAVVLANKAYERAKSQKGNETFCNQARLVAGSSSFLIGRFYIQEQNMEQAKLAMEVGAKLRSPQCMRMLTCWALDTTCEAQQMTQKEFSEHIATLHKAFEMGDLFAGEALAEHYFDGPQNPFMCGYWLPLDTHKAYAIAKKVGTRFTQACRIIGYFEFCRVQQNSKNKATADVVANSIQLLVQAAQKGCQQAYAHLLDVCQSPICTAEHKRSIVLFFEQKAEEKMPVGMCAMGSLLLLNPERDPAYIDKAISYFNEAARLSDDQFGHYELIELYTSDPDRYMQGTDLFKVAYHCIALLGSTVDIRDLGSQALDYFGKVIGMLHTYKGSDEHMQEAQRYFAHVVGRLHDIGVDVSHQNLSNEQFNKAIASQVVTVIPAMRMGDVSACVKVPQAHCNAIQLPENNLERLRYYKDTFIPTFRGEFDELDAICKEVAPIAHSSEVLASLAVQCLYALACNGCVPALEEYVDMFMQSSNKQEQNLALEAMYRCMTVIEKLDAQALGKCGIVEAYKKHIAFVKRLADTSKNGHAALVVAFWYSLCNTLKIEREDPEYSHATRYCELAAKSGCSGGIYIWNKNRLCNHQPLSKPEFNKTLQALESIMDQELSAAELLMELYAGRGKLPCGHTVPVNKKCAKKIALKIKDKSIPALKRLAIMAQEDKEYKKAILYALEIVKRKRLLDDMDLIEIAQNCLVTQVYPDEVAEYLESKAQEGYIAAKLTLGYLAVRRKQYDHAIELLNQVIDHGGNYSGNAHLEMAFVCMDQEWSGFNLAKGLEHAQIGIRVIVGESVACPPELGELGYQDTCRRHRASGIQCVQTLGMQLIKLMFNALGASLPFKQDLILKQEAGKVLEQLVDLIQEYRYFNPQSVEWPLIMATLQCHIGTDYRIIRRYFEDALAKLQVSKSREADHGYIGRAVSIMLSRLQVDAVALQKEGNALRANEIWGNIQDLLALIKKDKIIYYMVSAIEIEKK